ncbi:hypothetical protein HY989_01285 [Candidatus Micrarchaeota archaeon]|nr:hypothetical protein [Candidatus Micrarchaeota archaeon]
MKQIPLALLVFLALPIFSTALTPLTTCSTLSKSGETYVLQNDLTISSACFTISATNVDFDLNGKTIYFTSPTIKYPIKMSSTATGSKVHNGFITETSQLSAGDSNGALQMMCTNCKAYDLEIRTKSYHMPAIDIEGSASVEIYNSKIYIDSTTVANDDINVGGVNTYGVGPTTKVVFHNNYIKGRSWLLNLRGGTIFVYDNIIVPIKYGRNPYGIRTAADGGEIYGNTIQSTNCRGILVENGKNLIIRDNYMDCSETVVPGVDGAGTHTLRIRGTDNETNNNTVRNNIIIARALAGSNTYSVEGAMIGNWINTKVYDNTIVALTEVDGAETVALAVEGTLYPSTVVKNNILRSNSDSLRLGHSNTGTANGLFETQTLVKDPFALAQPYHSISNLNGRAATNEVFADFKYASGSQKSDILLGQGNAAYSYTFKWNLAISVVDSNQLPLSNAEVTITSKKGNIVYQGLTGISGKIVNLLKEFSAQNGVALDYDSPYLVTVIYSGAAVSKSVTLDNSKTETFMHKDGSFVTSTQAQSSTLTITPIPSPTTMQIPPGTTPSPTASITPMPTTSSPSPTATISPTPTATISPSPTPTPIPSPSPTPTPTATPTPSVSAAGTPLLSLISATSITQTSAVITWVSDIDSDSSVAYWKKPSTKLVFDDATKVLSHAISLSGLTANTLYYYTVRSCNLGKCTASNTYQFKTLRKLTRSTVGPTGMAVLTTINELEMKVDELRSSEDTSEIEILIEQSVGLVELGNEAQAESTIEEARVKTQELIDKVRGRARASKFDSNAWLVLLVALLAAAYLLYMNKSKPKAKGKKR